jgi:hypothetical protein
MAGVGSVETPDDDIWYPPSVENLVSAEHEGSGAAAEDWEQTHWVWSAVACSPGLVVGSCWSKRPQGKPRFSPIHQEGVTWNAMRPYVTYHMPTNLL